MSDVDAYALSLLIYNATLLPVIFVSVFFVLLVCLSRVAGWQRIEHKGDIGTPFITVQVPAYNDPVAARCVEHCLRFDYPKDKFEIQLVDDSTNQKTRALLESLAAAHPDLIRYVRRDNRRGFKPGALQEATKHARGEFIVLFDADWIPQPAFLREIIKPFVDPNVAYVQSRQSFYNQTTNLISRFASYLLMIYHTLTMPINNRINCVFFCGTGGAIRRSAFEAIGGWNTNSLTEDSDLTVRMLAKGYKSVYLPFETPSEVPDTFEAFLKQQLRWGYGNARVFFDHWKTILFGPKLTLLQRGMMGFITISNGTAFIVLVMTVAGMLGWFLGDPKLLTLGDFWKFSGNIVLTGGFLFAGLVTLATRRQWREMPHFVLAALTMGILLSGTMIVAFTKAALNKPLVWECTPKVANENVLPDEYS